MPITSKSSNFKGETQRYVVKLSKSVGAEQYCPKIPRLPTFPQSEVQEQPMEVTQFERVQHVQTSYSKEEIAQIHAEQLTLTFLCQSARIGRVVSAAVAGTDLSIATNA